jgi:hypothetical protein
MDPAQTRSKVVRQLTTGLAGMTGIYAIDLRYGTVEPAALA